MFHDLCGGIWGRISLPQMNLSLSYIKLLTPHDHCSSDWSSARTVKRFPERERWRFNVEYGYLCLGIIGQGQAEGVLMVRRVLLMSLLNMLSVGGLDGSTTSWPNSLWTGAPPAGFGPRSWGNLPSRGGLLLVAADAPRAADGWEGLGLSWGLLSCCWWLVPFPFWNRALRVNEFLRLSAMLDWGLCTSRRFSDDPVESPDCCLFTGECWSAPVKTMKSLKHLSHIDWFFKYLDQVWYRLSGTILIPTGAAVLCPLMSNCSLNPRPSSLLKHHNTVTAWLEFTGFLPSHNDNYQQLFH